MGAIYVTDHSDDEDRAYEDHRQRELDEARESELAFFAGKEARRFGATAGMNPHHSDHEIKAWLRGWQEVDARFVADALARRAA